MQYLFVFLKGLGMGAADVVPGVSGGTIAFISGIYERLLNAIKGVNLQAFQVLRKEGIAATWKHLDATFLLVLLAGILTSIFTLASAVTWALAAYPQLLWSFFMGLVIASALYVGRQIKFNNAPSIIALVVGIVIAYSITLLSPAEAPRTYPMAFIAGAIAICAMILPGISGSFILLLMGMYAHVMGAVKDRDLMFLMVVAAGCVVGLLSFSRLLSWMFKNYRSLTLAVLTGFMVGSLPKVWPWQNIVETRINSHGETVPFLYENVSPNHYCGTLDSSQCHESYVVACAILMVVGFAVVWILERLGDKPAEEKN